MLVEVQYIEVNDIYSYKVLQWLYVNIWKNIESISCQMKCKFSLTTLLPYSTVYIIQFCNML